MKQLAILLLTAFLLLGCAGNRKSTQSVQVERPTTSGTTEQTSAETTTTVTSKVPGSVPVIEIERNSPADTVRAFYENLRANKLRDAMFLTNLRPAIEGLTDNELRELQLDLAPLAAQVPENLGINGEIISGNYATVTARLPDNETRELRLQEIKLRKAENYWVMLTVDELAEPIIKREGRNYLFKLKIQSHEADAKAMLERVAKAQMVYSIQHDGAFGDLPSLVAAGVLPEDALSPASTGYHYRIKISPDGRSYVATADPAVYGKTGVLSFVMDLDKERKPKLAAADNRGKSSNS